MNKQNWSELATGLVFEGRAFIKGKYTTAQDGSTVVCINPASQTPLTTVTSCGTTELEAAVEAAREAIDSGVWSGLKSSARGAALKRLAALIRTHTEELALLESLNTGKPISDAIAFDIPNAARCIEWYAEAVDKVNGEVPDLGPQLVGLITREPIGVVAAITPWSFPLLMASWKLGPALAAGNAVILKPSEKTPLTTLRIAALAKEAGIPDGILQVLPGCGALGRQLALHRDIDCITFSGSTQVGKHIADYAAQSNLKRVWLTLGGKSPNIILPDCLDLVHAAQSTARSIFYNAGQMFYAGSRVLVHRDIKASFLSLLTAAASLYHPGDPLDPDTRMGAIIDEDQFNTILSYIDNAQRQGAQLVFGGKAVPVPTQGYFIEPTILDCPRPDLTVCREEIFGPVLSVITFRDIEEAVRIANDTDYGLAAAVWTSNITIAHQMARRLKVGTVWINCYAEENDITPPFGGFKQSGNGRDTSIHALEQYTELKTTLVKL